MWEGLGFVCPGAGRGPLGPYLLQSQNRLGVPLTRQHRGSRPDPKPYLLTSYPYLLCQQSPPPRQTPLLSLSCRKNSTWHFHITLFSTWGTCMTFPFSKPNSNFTHPFKMRLEKLSLWNYHCSQYLRKYCRKKGGNCFVFNWSVRCPFLGLVSVNTWLLSRLCWK